MTDISIEAAQDWIRRLEADLAELESLADYRMHLHTAEGIRHEIDHVRQVIELTSLRRGQRVVA